VGPFQGPILRHSQNSASLGLCHPGVARFIDGSRTGFVFERDHGANQLLALQVGH
jgi:hypothetical protein